MGESGGEASPRATPSGARIMTVATARPAAGAEGWHSWATSESEIDEALAALHGTVDRWRATTAAERREMLEACLTRLEVVAPGWVRDACRAKGLDADGPGAAEEIAAGPIAVARNLRLLIDAFSDLEQGRAPRLPGRPRKRGDGWAAPVMPALGLTDRVLFAGVRARTLLGGAQVQSPTFNAETSPGVALVLGAGNVAGIAPSDLLTKLFQEGRPVLLKMNPVNAYLGPHLADLFRPLVERDLVRIVYGGAQAGAYCVDHSLVAAVHITGSDAAFQRIVWGAGDEGRRNRAAGTPRLTKPITGELGNVTPVIVVPGRYSERALAYHAENVAAMIVNNASFNCIAAKVVVTWRDWPQRIAFIERLRACLRAVPPRRAYYPGAVQRYAELMPDGETPASDAETLPWRLFADVSPIERPELFGRENFVCVSAETALDAPDAVAFLDKAVDFANDKVAGTLGVSVIAPPSLRRRHRRRFDRAIDRLRYGTVAINTWSGLAFALMATPWGGGSWGDEEGRDRKEGDPARPGSGIGWVHNPFFLADPVKTVVDAPFVMRPKPLWFPTNRTAHRTAWAVLRQTCRPSLARLAAVIPPALFG